MSWRERPCPRYTSRNFPRNRGERGFSAGELLVVVAIIGLIVAVTVPLVAQNVRMAKIRAAGDQFAMSLKAARMIAVSTHQNVPVTVNTTPTNSYSYTDNKGNLRQIAMPDGVVIQSSDSPITFTSTGAISAASARTTVLETTLNSGVIERWTITTSLMGVPTVDHVKVTP